MAAKQFQVICLNKNNEAVKVFRISAASATEAKESIHKRFMFEGAPLGATCFRLVPLDHK